MTLPSWSPAWLANSYPICLLASAGQWPRHWRLAVFPESAPPILVERYEDYRQLIVRGYRAIYRYFPDEDEVRVYCILHPRRRLPAVEFLIHQTFW